ncbi:DUF998 domain-containing protein [Streptomyces sp. URMC 123]|uniref:DUF998 domain-containing protein n=1 Tax=Streptomyces sp. URMC 123 TaxID=3423403 RepID=UPI003F1B5708
MTRGPRIVPALLLLGAVAYTAWVLEAVLTTGLDPVRSYVSELAATDQPYGALFRTTDLIAGLLVLAGAALGLWRAERRLWETLGWAGLALFGAATAADSRLSMSCAPTHDAGCAAREAAGDVPFGHSAHAVTSSLAMAGALVGLIALTLAARRYGGRRPVARLGPALVAVELIATVWTLVSVAAFEAREGTWALGLGQRLQVLLVAVWIALFAVALLRAPQVPAVPGGDPAAPTGPEDGRAEDSRADGSRPEGGRPEGNRPGNRPAASRRAEASRPA